MTTQSIFSAFLSKDTLAHLCELSSHDEMLRKLPALLSDGCGFERVLVYMPDGKGLYRLHERHPTVATEVPEALPTSAQSQNVGQSAKLSQTWLQIP